MRRIRHGVFTPFVVVLMLLGLLGQPFLATAEIIDPNATETAVPTDVSTEPTDDPVETEVPATDVPPTDEPEPTDIPATEVPPTDVPATDVPATDVPPTATDVPSEDADLSIAAIQQLTIQFEQCGDSSRLGVTDFFFDGSFGAAAIGVDCAGAGTINGSTITVTFDGGGSNLYTVNLDSSGYGYLDSSVEEGTYSVFVGAGEDYSASMQGQIVLDENGYHTLRIVRYVDGGQTPGGEGVDTNQVSGTVFYCRDSARDGQIDVLVAGQAVDQFEAQGEASECVPPQQGQINLTFGGEDYNGRPYSASITSGNFSLFPVPSSTGPGYTFTNQVSGLASDPVIVGGSNGGNLNVTVYVYYAEEAQLLANLSVAKTVCAVPEGDDRAGSTEFVVIADGGFSASATCYAVSETFDPPITFTLSQGETVVGTQQVSYSYQGVVFGQLSPGTYTLSESQGEGGYNATSDPFTLAYGDNTYIQVVNYVPGGDGGEPGSGFFNPFNGSVLYCTSPELAGTVDFQIQQQGGPLLDQISAQGTSECRYATAGEGEVSIRVFETGEGGEPELVTEIPAPIGSGGYFSAFYFNPDNTETPRSFQVVFRTGSFDGEFTSDIFAAPAFAGTAIGILAYVAPSDTTTDIAVNKNFCFDAARDGQTDFFVNERPAPDIGIRVAAAATTECLPAAYNFGTITYTLTNTGTGESATRTTSTNGFPFGVSTASFTNVPAGTYTLREQATFEGGEGEDPLVYDATSDPFTVAEGVPYYQIAVKNYTGDEAPEGSQEDIFFFGLNAFTCVDTAREGEFEYFYQGLTFQPTGVGAAATSECAISTPGEYEFVLDGPQESEVSAQAIIPLEPADSLTGFQFAYGTDEGDDPLPSGTYVIRELVTGSESEPIVLDQNQYEAEFYFYVAAPTPTPTVTPTPTLAPGVTPTATATLEPGVTPSATATLEPGVTPTATVDPSAPTRISQNPPGGDGPIDSDGDGIPDDVDPDDDNDGIPDGDVTELPSTGQGSQDGTLSLTWAALAGALILLALAWSQALRARR